MASSKKVLDGVGGHIGGAVVDMRKRNAELNKKNLLDLTQPEKEKLVRKTNIWTKADFKELKKKGFSADVVAYMEAIRSALPPSPKDSHLEYYIDYISNIRDEIMSINPELKLNEVQEKFKKFWENKYYIRVGERTVRKNKEADIASEHGLLTNTIFKRVFNFHIETKKGKYNKIWEDFIKDDESEQILKKSDVWADSDYDELIRSGFSPDVVAYMEDVKSTLPNRACDDDFNYYKKFIEDLRDEFLSIDTNLGLKDVQKIILDYWEEKYYTRDKRILNKNEEGKVASGHGLLGDATFHRIFNSHKMTNKGKYRKTWDDFKKKEKSKNISVKGELKKEQETAGYFNYLIREGGAEHSDRNDVTEEEFIEIVRPRATEFGLQMRSSKNRKSNEKQDAMNLMFNALVDYNDILDAGKFASTLGGKLAVAIGSRGRGGINSACAHYERARVVFNVTKENGDGSVAHEIGHAMDNMFGTLSDQNHNRELHTDIGGDIKYMASNIMASEGGCRCEHDKAIDNVCRHLELIGLSLKYNDIADRQEEFNASGQICKHGHYSHRSPFETHKAIDSLEKKIKKTKKPVRKGMLEAERDELIELLGGKTDFYKRSLELDEMEDRSKPYWSTTREMFTRAHVSSMLQIMRDKGMRNDYLISQISSGDMVGDSIPNPFPLNEEKDTNTGLYKELYRLIKKSSVFDGKKIEKKKAKKNTLF